MTLGRRIDGYGADIQFDCQNIGKEFALIQYDFEHCEWFWTVLGRIGCEMESGQQVVYQTRYSAPFLLKGKTSVSVDDLHFCIVFEGKS